MIASRLHRRTLLTVAVTVLPLLAGVASAQADARQVADAGQFVARMAQTAIDDLATADVPDPQRQQRFRELFEEAFDVPLIARFVLGRYWRQASDGEKREYLKLFDELVVQTYSRRFTEFNGARFRVLSVSKPNEDNDVIVGVEGTLVGKPPIRLDVRVRQAGNVNKIIDVAVEGVSMLITQRDEFASVIQRGGGRVDALLANLREKVGTR
ncbi:MAG: ABC transporter substrate-binding protein [Alphaproteobacteria bacterium]|nr:ABC transporter substrate-binding protein [Alphaproteobacteria bacterium]